MSAVTHMKHSGCIMEKRPYGKEKKMAAILIVEDDKTTNDLIRDYLCDAGHSVRQAYDGREALRRFAEESAEL